MRVIRYINEEDLNAYELDNKRLSYKNLFYKEDSLILCNNIINQYESLELQSGFNDDGWEECDDIYQYYIIDDDTAKRMIELDEIVYYHNDLDIYILGVTHYGTNWGYILTNVRIEREKDNDNWFVCYIDEEEESEDDE